ncbi:GNAT family N-acetyltransferase [Glutamicibacter sp.]|uniref:GNAT family N-acetyltransferase n=1 Tax=Glutamicibacter sp. TaxID=1931995 RepID=UPI0028BE5FE1|nr:GNAT family N-acetyltransferase [Glutamicibacter sp.]
MEKSTIAGDLSPSSELGLLIIEHEQRLLRTQTRANSTELELLLHERFEEIGKSGRHFDRQQIIEALALDPVIDSGDKSPHPGLADPRLLQLSESWVLLRYRLVTDPSTRRCSLWVKESNRWQLYFHQGTTSPGFPALAAAAAAPAASSHGAYLRPLHPSDAPALLEAFDSAPDMLRQGEVTTLEQARSYVQLLLADSPEQLPLALCIEGQLVGLVCARVDRRNRNAWVWYWLHAAFRGRGLTVRAVRALAALLFERQGIQRLELGLRANNPASKKVAEAAGFLREGVERGKFLIDGERIDVLTYSRLVNDPVPEGETLRVI